MAHRPSVPLYVRAVLASAVARWFNWRLYDLDVLARWAKCVTVKGFYDGRDNVHWLVRRVNGRIHSNRNGGPSVIEASGYIAIKWFRFGLIHRTPPEPAYLYFSRANPLALPTADYWIAGTYKGSAPDYKFSPHNV